MVPCYRFALQIQVYLFSNKLSPFTFKYTLVYTDICEKPDDGKNAKSLQ